MGHVINYYDYAGKVNKRAVEAELDDMVRHETYKEGGNGLDGGIRWLDFICANRDSAREYIDSHDKGWYDNLAVQYRHYPKPMTSKKYEDLMRRYDEARKQYNELSNALYCKEFKSQYLGCKKCGSKLNKDYMRSNNCPLCGEDMRSDTTKKNIARLRDLCKDLEKRLKEERNHLEEKAIKSSVIRWLVKIEYHS